MANAYTPCIPLVGRDDVLNVSDVRTPTTDVTENKGGDEAAVYRLLGTDEQHVTIEMDILTEVNETTKEVTKEPENPPNEIRLKLLLACITLINPLLAPLLWYIVNGYRTKWRKGMQGSADCYMKQAIVLFIIGVFLTVSILVFSILTVGIHGRTDKHIHVVTINDNIKQGNQLPPRQTGNITSVNITALREESRKKIENSSGQKLNHLDVPADGEVKIIFQNETFTRIYSVLKGYRDLPVPPNFSDNGD